MIEEIEAILKELQENIQQERALNKKIINLYERQLAVQNHEIARLNNLLAQYGIYPGE
jgi:hypothetical protein